MERSLFKFYRSYFDVASELSDKDRLAFYDALVKREFLGIEPDLSGMAKFAYISQKHSIDSQVNGWIDRMKSEFQIPNTPPNTPPIEPPSGQEKEKEKEEVKEKEEKENKNFDFRKSLIALSVSKEVVRDWLIVRKNKKASNTETAFKLLVKEIEKSGLSANECITISVEKNWSGFRSEWINNLQQNAKTIKSDSIRNDSQSVASTVKVFTP